MCDGVSAALLVATTVASIGMQQVQAHQAAKEATAQAKYAAEAQDNEQARNMEEARRALQRGELEADRQRRQASRANGGSVSMLAASGFELDSGSNLSLLMENAEEAQHENAMIRFNAANEAWQYQNRAVDNLNAQASALAQGQNAANKAHYQANMASIGAGLQGIGSGMSLYGKKTKNDDLYDYGSIISGSASIFR